MNFSSIRIKYALIAICAIFTMCLFGVRSDAAATPTYSYGQEGTWTFTKQVIYDNNNPPRRLFVFTYTGDTCIELILMPPLVCCNSTANQHYAVAYVQDGNWTPPSYVLYGAKNLPHIGQSADACLNN